MVITLDMMQTLMLAVLFLFIGAGIRNVLPIFDRFVIPSPVVGGILFALLHLIFYQTGTLVLELDMTFKEPLMLLFFASIGYATDLNMIKRGGRDVIIFFVVAAVLMVIQNIWGAGMAGLMGENRMLGLITGSMSMTGGHSTAAAWAPTLVEDFGFTEANTIGAASATFGLIAGSLIGAPIGQMLIKRKNLKPAEETESYDTDEVSQGDKSTPDYYNMMLTLIFLLLSVVLGSLTSDLLTVILPQLVFPPAVLAMAYGALFRNLLSNPITYYEGANTLIQDIALNVFLALALVELKLWELQPVAGAMLVILIGQVVIMAVYAVFVTYRTMGTDYDAAVLSGGHCGFGMGASPNGIANMQALTKEFGPAPRAFFVLPLVSMLCDFSNMFILTFFINILG